MSNTYTTEQAKEAYLKAVAYDLSGAELLSNPDDVITDCNGVGADWMPEKARDLITSLNKYMEIPAMIHDRRYMINGTDDDRAFADKEFYDNVCKVIKAEYAWYNPLRYTHLIKAHAYYKILCDFGKTAWNECKKQNEATENTDTKKVN